MSDQSHLSPEERTRLQYDALTRQLERMRGMQYGYFTKFFWWVTLTLLVLMYLLLNLNPMGYLVAPFLVITAGVQASFYLHFVDFARVHARAVEKKLNQLLGEEVLLGAQIEDLYFYPLDQPKFSGFSFAKPAGFFSVYTLHWCGLWTMIFLYTLSLGYWSLSGDRELAGWLLPYLLLLSGWAFVNVAYLFVYFARGRDLKAVADKLAVGYGDQ